MNRFFLKVLFPFYISLGLAMEAQDDCTSLSPFETTLPAEIIQGGIIPYLIQNASDCRSLAQTSLRMRSHVVNASDFRAFCGHAARATDTLEVSQRLSDYFMIQLKDRLGLTLRVNRRKSVYECVLADENFPQESLEKIMQKAPTSYTALEARWVYLCLKIVYKSCVIQKEYNAAKDNAKKENPTYNFGCLYPYFNTPTKIELKKEFYDLAMQGHPMASYFWAMLCQRLCCAKSGQTPLFCYGRRKRCLFISIKEFDEVDEHDQKIVWGPKKIIATFDQAIQQGFPYATYEMASFLYWGKADIYNYTTRKIETLSLIPFDNLIRYFPKEEKPKRDEKGHIIRPKPWFRDFLSKEVVESGRTYLEIMKDYGDGIGEDCRETFTVAELKKLCTDLQEQASTGRSYPGLLTECFDKSSTTL